MSAADNEPPIWEAFAFVIIRTMDFLISLATPSSSSTDGFLDIIGILALASQFCL